MILTAGLLVLLGFGLFVAGILTGVTALYWACVAACVLTAVPLFLARRGLAQREAAGARSTASAPASTRPAEAAGSSERPAEAATAAAATQEPAASRVHFAGPAAEERGEPPAEDVEVTDLLLVVDLKDEVLVVDEHPRYHLAGCVHLTGHTPIPLPHDEARADGFTPCGVCTPDQVLADRVRAGRGGGAGGGSGGGAGGGRAGGRGRAGDP